jgi:integrase/recombinase XerD
MKTYPLPIHVQRFFTDRHVTQFPANPNTVASYPHTFRQLQKYTIDRIGRHRLNFRSPTSARTVGGFLTFVETNRNNGAQPQHSRSAGAVDAGRGSLQAGSTHGDRQGIRDIGAVMVVHSY